jgi:hypothetical protein
MRQVIRTMNAAAMEACAREVVRAARASDVRERLRATYAELGLLEDPDIGGAMRLLLSSRVDRRTGPR